MKRRNRIPDEDALIEEGRSSGDCWGSKEKSSEIPAGKEVNPGWQEATNTRELNIKEDCFYSRSGVIISRHAKAFFHLLNASLNPVLSGTKCSQNKVIESRHL